MIYYRSDQYSTPIHFHNGSKISSESTCEQYYWLKIRRLLDIE